MQRLKPCAVAREFQSHLSKHLRLEKSSTLSKDVITLNCAEVNETQSCMRVLGEENRADPVVSMGLFFLSINLIWKARLSSLSGFYYYSIRKLKWLERLSTNQKTLLQFSDISAAFQQNLRIQSACLSVCCTFSKFCCKCHQLIQWATFIYFCLRVLPFHHHH